MGIKSKLSNFFSFGKRAMKTKDGKALAENFTYLSILQVASYVLPFITIPYLSRVIGVDGFGKIAFASAIMVWVQTIVDWGFGFSATREVAKNRDNKEVISDIFSNVLWARLLLSALCFLILLILTLTIPLLRDNAVVLLFTFLLVPGHILFPDWFFQGIEKMKYTTIFNIAIKFAFTIAVFFVIKEEKDYIFQPLLASIGYIVSGLVACVIIRNKWGVRLHSPNFKMILQYLKKSFDIFIGNLFPTMYNNFSIVLLGALGSPTANGLYDGGNKFVSVIQQFMTIIGRTFYPYLNRRSDKHTQYAMLHLSIAGVASLFLFLIAPFLIHLFLTPEFEESIYVLRIMSPSIFFLSLSSVYCVNYLFVKGCDREARNITIVSSLIGFLLAYPMIKHFGFIGAAINVTLTRAIMGVLYFVFAKRHKVKTVE